MSAFRQKKKILKSLLVLKRMIIFAKLSFKSRYDFDTMKHLYIIAGCNGAGKTTASMTILPKSLLVKEFVNADEIAKGISPFNPEGVAIEAGRLMLERIDYLLAKGESFSIETTLATRSYVSLVRKASRYKFIKSYVK